MLEINGLTPLIQVFSMSNALGFYRDILGFEVVGDSGNGDDSSWVWLRMNGSDLMLNDQYEPGRVPSDPLSERNRWHGDTCLYFGCPDPDKAYEYLRSRNIECEPPKVAWYGMKQLHLHDPDGYALCFQRPATEEEKQN